MNDVSMKIVFGKDAKRGSSTVSSQEGVESKKKRKTEG
jgi:hypothetical protein